MHTENDKRKLINLASAFIEAMIERGEIQCSDEAIKATMPQAIRDAAKVLNAVDEYLAG